MKLKTLLICLILSAFALQIRAQTEMKNFRGFINGKRIEMSLARDGNRLSGTYFYTKYKTDLKLSGTIGTDGKFKLEEYDPKGAKTGEFTGTWHEDPNDNGVVLQGEWTKPKGGEALYFSADEQMVNFSSGKKLLTKSIAETNKPKRFEMTAEYPEITGVDAQIAAKFNNLVKARVMKPLNEVKKGMLAQTAEDLKYLPSGSNNYIEISYNVALANDDLISLQFGDSEYSGGAHPNHGSFAVNFDLKNGRELKLADLFKPNSNYLKTISDYAIADLKKQLSEMTDDEWIKNGAGAKAENYQSWNLTKKGLMITFDPYQVAAYAAGEQTVIIPYARLENVLRPEIKQLVF